MNKVGGDSWGEHNDIALSIYAFHIDNVFIFGLT